MTKSAFLSFSFILIMTFSILVTNANLVAPNQDGIASFSGTGLQSNEPIQTGLRTDCFWDQYIKTPQDFLSLAKGKVTMIYLDLPWVKEIFVNFDPKNLGKPFAKGNWGYDYTFRDYIEFFKVMNANGIEIVLAIMGEGSSSKPYLNFFSDYPNSALDSEWVNPDYVDPSWNGKTFLQMYAEKINNFASLIGVPAIVSIEDWRYPGYMMQYQELVQLKDALKALNQSNDVWMPPASFGSAEVADYNAYESDHPWTWEFASDGMTVGGSDVVLQDAWDQYNVYHSAINVVGWIGAQMSAMPYGSGIIVKLYFGGQDLNLNNPNYALPQMKKKLEDIITACYLTRVITPDGEYCPVKGFILVYKPPPNAALNDMLDILQYANDMEYLRTVQVLGPVLEIPRNLGYMTYSPQTSPMGGYMIGEGLIPFRFVYENCTRYLGSAVKVVTNSGEDYSHDIGVNFDTTKQCTWLCVFNYGGQEYLIVFHDGGYESGIYKADGSYQPPDTTSYKQPSIVKLNSLTLNISQDSVTFFDTKGNFMNPQISMELGEIRSLFAIGFSACVHFTSEEKGRICHAT